ncbi:hypothetical protein KOR42_10660 [Thalassoglobus neptunius]|uniref:Uncharacterized protein n=1 Tax=Thalassoglobus neptunius TaxID=1938619 RepID=A0A5C5X6R0_9PLAN|nr:hypothetical protein [Thalassoglobus neptunius]TWT57702.1 hypothetical protein KOR42_10660 [Thalassoglobus neptunius]
MPKTKEVVDQSEFESLSFPPELMPEVIVSRAKLDSLPVRKLPLSKAFRMVVEDREIETCQDLREFWKLLRSKKKPEDVRVPKSMQRLLGLRFSDEAICPGCGRLKIFYQSWWLCEAACEEYSRLQGYGVLEFRELSKVFPERVSK